MSARGAPIAAIIPPPVQFAATFLAGMGIDWLAPWRPAWMAMRGVHWTGAALVVAGFILAVVAAGGFLFRRTTLHPTGQPARLVVSGAHAFTRNPMYLSLTVIYVGLALALGRAWPLILVILPWASINWVVIPFEEARLHKTFGQEYADYCGEVRRWI